MVNLLTNKEAAEILTCSWHTLNQSRSKGTLFGVKAPQYKKVGRAVRYDKAVLEQWLKDNTK